MNKEHTPGNSAKGKASGNAISAESSTDKLWQVISTAGIHLRHWITTGFSERQRLDPLVLLAVILLGMLAAFTLLPGNLISDEGFHWSQVSEYFAGRFGTINSVTMLPGYHMVIYAVSELFSIRSPVAVRYVCFALAIPALLFFFLIARQYDKSTSCPVSIQFYLSPLFFPFFFLLYTDMPSLTMVMGSLWLVTTRRFHLAALTAGLSLLIRQTNIVWLVMLWVLVLADMGFFAFSASNVAGTFRKCLKSLLRTWLFALFCLLFAVFLYVNGGVAIGDQGAHQIGFYPTQVFLLLFMLFFLFVPLHIANYRKIASMLKSEPLLLLAAAILFAVYIFTFSADHHYNTQESTYFLRNILLAHMREGFLPKALFFIPIVIAFFSIVATPLRRPVYYWLYPFLILFLLPIKLIDPRYFFIPLALFMLFRKPLDSRFEYLQAAVYVPLTVYIFEGIYQLRFFP